MQTLCLVLPAESLASPPPLLLCSVTFVFTLANLLGSLFPFPRRSSSFKMPRTDCRRKRKAWSTPSLLLCWATRGCSTSSCLRRKRRALAMAVLPPTTLRSTALLGFLHGAPAFGSRVRPARYRFCFCGESPPRVINVAGDTRQSPSAVFVSQGAPTARKRFVQCSFRAKNYATCSINKRFVLFRF